MASLTRIGMPLTDFIQQTNEQVFEIINGERIPKLPTVGGHNYVLNLLFKRLSSFSKKRSKGNVSPKQLMFSLTGMTRIG